MSILSAVSSILQPNQATKSPSFAQILKNFWKSPNTSREVQSAAHENGPSYNYDLIENGDNEFDHLLEKDCEDQFDNLKLELLTEEEEEGAEYWSGNESFEKLKDLSDSLDEAEARLEFVLKSSDSSFLTLDSLSLTSSITSETGDTDSESDFLWSGDEGI